MLHNTSVPFSFTKPISDTWLVTTYTFYHVSRLSSSWNRKSLESRLRCPLEIACWCPGIIQTHLIFRFSDEINQSFYIPKVRKLWTVWEKRSFCSLPRIFSIWNLQIVTLWFLRQHFFLMKRRMKVRLRSLVFWSISCLCCFRWIVEVFKTAYRLGVKCTSNRRGLSFMFRYSILSVSFSSTLVICRLYDFSPFPYKYLVIVAALKMSRMFSKRSWPFKNIAKR